MKHTKIILVIDSFTTPNAGTEGQVTTLINALLAKRTFDVELIVLGRMMDELLLPFNCKVHHMKNFSIKNPFSWLKFFNLCKLRLINKETVFHTYFIDASICTPLIAKLLGAPCIVSRRDMGYWYTAGLLFVLRIIAKLATGFLVNSHAIGNLINEKEGVSHNKIKVIYNGYKQLGRTNRVGGELASLVGEIKAVKVVLVANIRPVKRVEDAVRALQLMAASNVHLFVVGGGETSDLKTLAKNLDVDRKVTFLGPQDAIPSLLSFMDIGLLCSASEGYSNAILEYQFAKLPVVCSYTGGNIEAVEHEVDGFHFDVGNIDLMAKQLESLCIDPDKRNEMGLKGHEKAVTRHNVESMVSSHTKLYKKALR